MVAVVAPIVFRGPNDRRSLPTEMVLADGVCGCISHDYYRDLRIYRRSYRSQPQSDYKVLLYFYRNCAVFGSVTILHP